MPRRSSGSALSLSSTSSPSLTWSQPCTWPRRMSLPGRPSRTNITGRSSSTRRFSFAKMRSRWKRWTKWQRSFSWWKLQECLCCGNCYTRFVRDFLSTLSPQSSLSPQLKDWISSARTMKSLTGSLLSDLALLGLFFDVSGVKRNCSQCFFPFDTKSILWTIKLCAKRWIEMKSHLKQFILILILLLDILIQSTSLQVYLHWSIVCDPPFRNVYLYVCFEPFMPDRFSRYQMILIVKRKQATSVSLPSESRS